MGLNQYEDIENSTVSLQNINQDSIDDQLKRLQKFKSTRNNDNVMSSLQQLETSLNNNDNLLPVIIKCIKNNCTLGEICETMRTVHGEYL